MQVGKFWLITIDTINGPWHVASLQDGKGHSMGRGMGNSGSWYIVNKDTGRSRRIGPVKMRGKNWCDEAIAEAKRRNIALGFSQAFDSAGNLVDPDGMTDKDKAMYWEKEARRLMNLETNKRKELARLLINKGFCKVCPATWDSIIILIKELLDSWRLGPYYKK